MCRANAGYESPAPWAMLLARGAVTLHQLVVNPPGRPRRSYEEERQPLDPGFLAKTSELADRSAESAAAYARARRAAGADRQTTLDVIKVGPARLVVAARDQNVTSNAPAVT